jgi:hypothetical protein
MAMRRVDNFSSLQRAQIVKFGGELGMAYRRGNRLPDTKYVFKMQYDKAKQLRVKRAMR